MCVSNLEVLQQQEDQTEVCRECGLVKARAKGILTKTVATDESLSTVAYE